MKKNILVMAATSKNKSISIAIITFAVIMTSCAGIRKSNGPELNHNARNDSWGIAGYGGGGAMFYPAVSPFNPGYVFVACDMTGSYVTYNGGGSWRMFNLRGPVDFFVFDPKDSNTVYANSIGLFKSSDHGTTWKLLYPAPSEIKGVISRGDHATEIIVTKDSTERNVQSFAIDPDDSRKLYAVISINKIIAFYISNDGGSHWTKEKELQEKVRNIYVHPSSPKDRRSVYLTGTNSILTRENGQWKINGGPKGVKQLTSFSGGYDKQLDKFIIYAISGKSYFNPAGDQSGIYFTDNGGETWENRQEGIPGLNREGSGFPEWRAIATSALHPEIVYVSYDGLTMKDAASMGVARSEDYGKTWKLSWEDRIGKDGSIISPNFKGGWIDERFGPSWSENPFSIGVSPVNPDICYATDFGRTVKTTDGGKSWEQVYTRKKNGAGWISRGLDVTTGYSVVFDPFDTNHVFIANTDIGLMESGDGGESWESEKKNNGVPREWINSVYWLVFDMEIKGRGWAVMSGTHDLPRPKMWRKNGVKGYKGGIVMTDNAGQSWKPVSGDIGEGAFTHILVDPSSSKEARTLYACAFGKGVYKSVDGGTTWVQKNNGIEKKEPFAWRIERRDKDGTLFLIISRRDEDDKITNEGDGSIYRSDNGAESWTKISLPAGTNAPTSLAIDNGLAGTLILSAWGRRMKGPFTPDSGGGIFLSNDDGKSWKPVLQHDQHIHDITIDQRNHDYYACGFNGSAYRSEDRGETWKRIKGYNFKWGKRIDFDPRHPDKIFIITYGGGVWYGPVAGDESAMEDITTPEIAR